MGGCYSEGKQILQLTEILYETWVKADTCELELASNVLSSDVRVMAMS